MRKKLLMLRSAGVVILSSQFVSARDEALDTFQLDKDGNLLLEKKLAERIPGLEKSLERFDALRGEIAPGVEKIEKIALAGYLNSGLKMPPAARISAGLRLRQGTERIYGESDIFSPSTEEILDSLRANHSLPNTSLEDARAQLERLSLSVGLIVPTDSIMEGFQNKSLLAVTYGANFNLCPGNPEFNTPSVRRSGTGFLIGGNRVATAGHCVDKLGENLSIIFGYTDKLPTESETGSTSIRVVLAGENVFVRQLSLLRKPSESQYSRTGDWALLEIVGALPDAIVPLDMNVENVLPAENQNLIMLGHPCGMPLRAATKGRVVRRGEIDFTTNLDAFIGNSGSPVFNGATWRVEGILVRGGDDFTTINTGGCAEWVVVADEPPDGGGETVTRILPVAAAMTQ